MSNAFEKLRDKKVELCAALGIDPSETTHVKIEFDVGGPIYVEAKRLLVFADEIVDASTVNSTVREYRKA